MRRAVLALAAGGALLTASACGTATGPAVTGQQPAPAVAASAQPTARAETKAYCEALGDVYNKNMGPLAEALSKMVADRTAAGGAQASQDRAEQTLSAFATAVRGATQGSTDAKLRADGKQAADRLQAKSADAKFFGTIRTSQDVNTVLGPTLAQWLAPVTKHCS